MILRPGETVIARRQLPLTAALQVGFHLASLVTNDEAVCQGYAVVARRPESRAS